MSVAARGPVRLWRMMRQIDSFYDSFYGAYGTPQYGQAPSPALAAQGEWRVFVLDGET
jgi:hypothetical protein